MKSSELTKNKVIEKNRFFVIKIQGEHYALPKEYQDQILTDFSWIRISVREFMYFWYNKITGLNVEALEKSNVPLGLEMREVWAYIFEDRTQIFVERDIVTDSVELSKTEKEGMGKVLWERVKEEGMEWDIPPKKLFEVWE